LTVLNFTAWQSRATGEALRLAIRLRNERRLFRRDNLELEDLFKGDIDPFFQNTSNWAWQSGCSMKVRGKVCSSRL